VYFEQRNTVSNAKETQDAVTKCTLYFYQIDDVYVRKQKFEFNVQQIVNIYTYIWLKEVYKHECTFKT